MTPSSGANCVVDASAAVRALVGLDEQALRWMVGPVSWPTLVYAEFAHSVLRLHRQQVTPLARAREAVDAIYAAPAHEVAVESLARDAWELGLARNISAYDACYVVLAEGLDLPLVTADRRLAGVTPNATLLT